MAQPAELKRALLAHLAAGCLAVAGITGLGIAYLIPLIIAASAKGGRSVALAAGTVVLGTFVIAVAVWLAFYVPTSVLAARITTKRSARLWLAALLCTLGSCAALELLVNRYDHAPHLASRAVLFLMAVILGSGCALYAFLKVWIAERVLKERSLVP